MLLNSYHKVTQEDMNISYDFTKQNYKIWHFSYKLIIGKFLVCYHKKISKKKLYTGNANQIWKKIVVFVQFKWKILKCWILQRYLNPLGTSEVKNMIQNILFDIMIFTTYNWRIFFIISINTIYYLMSLKLISPRPRPS